MSREIGAHKYCIR